MKNIYSSHTFENIMKSWKFALDFDRNLCNLEVFLSIGKTNQSCSSGSISNLFVNHLLKYADRFLTTYDHNLGKIKWDSEKLLKPANCTF